MGANKSTTYSPSSRSALSAIPIFQSRFHDPPPRQYRIHEAYHFDTAMALDTLGKTSDTMKVTYKRFRKSGKVSLTHYVKAAALASQLGAGALISISHSEVYVVVWYWE